MFVFVSGFCHDAVGVCCSPGLFAFGVCFCVFDVWYVDVGVCFVGLVCLLLVFVDVYGACYSAIGVCLACLPLVLALHWCVLV